MKTPKYKQWIRDAGWHVLAQRPRTIAGAYCVRFTFHRPDNRRRDQDNLVKALSDLLVRQRVVTDDSRAVETTLAWQTTEPGIAIVQIWPAPTGGPHSVP